MSSPNLPALERNRRRANPTPIGYYEVDTTPPYNTCQVILRTFWEIFLSCLDAGERVFASCIVSFGNGATITGVKHILPYIYSFLAGFGTAVTVHFFRNK